MTASISVAFGNLSLFCWLFAQAPQIYTNYKNGQDFIQHPPPISPLYTTARGSVEGLALPFLINWMMGDATNLIGCILTDQLAFQKQLATFFCAIDVILMSQYFYYTRRKPSSPLPPLSEAHSRSRSKSRFRVVPTHPHAHGDPSSSHHSLPRSPSGRMSDSYMSNSDHNLIYSSRPGSQADLNVLPDTPNTERPRLSASRHRKRSYIFLSVFVMMGFNLTKRNMSPNVPIGGDTWATAAASQIATPQEVGQNWEHLIGRMSAWACALLYFTSRLPQCWLNYRRKSCEGLTMLLFTAAFCGNLTYVISVLTSPTIKTDPTFLAESAPYLIGSGGTLGFDLTILTQAYLYRPSQAIQSHKATRRRQGSISAVEEQDGVEQPLLASPAHQDAEDRRGRPVLTSRTAYGHNSGLMMSKERSSSRRGPLSEGLQVTPILEVSESSPRS